MPPRVSTSSTRNSRIGPKAWPLSHGVCGHGTRSMVVRMAVMVVSVMRWIRGELHIQPRSFAGFRRVAKSATSSRRRLRYGGDTDRYRTKDRPDDFAVIFPENREAGVARWRAAAPALRNPGDCGSPVLEDR